MDHEIEHIEHRIHSFEKRCHEDPDYFAGTAIISY